MGTVTRRVSVAALASVVLVACSSDPAETVPTSAPTTSAVPVTTAPPVTDPPPATVVGGSLLDQMYARIVGRWAMVFSTDDTAGAPPRNPQPYLELRAPRIIEGVAHGLSLGGYDGCNWLGVDAQVDADGVMSDVRGESTAMACNPPGIEAFADGTRIAWLADDRLEFTSPAGDKYVFASLGGELATEAAQLTGEWQVDVTTPVRLSLGNGWFSLGGCHGTWTVDEVGRLDTEWNGDPYTCLVAAQYDVSQSAGRLVEVLVSDSAVVHRDGDTLSLATDQFSFSLLLVGEAIDPDRLMLASGSAFGLRPGDDVDVDLEVVRISDVLDRQPTLDTGWYPVPDEPPADGGEDCIGGPDYRVVWWGDLRLAFWRHPEGTFGSALWNWSVGDRDVMWFGKSEPDSPPDAEPSGLDSGMGFAIGDPVSAIDPSLVTPMGTTDDGLFRYTVTSTGYAVVAARDGLIVGFGSQLLFC